MPHVTHYDNLGTARFITFSCYRRYRLLTADTDIKIFLKELEINRRKYGFSIFGYVVMPNHVHLVLHSTDYLKIGSVVGAIKKASAFKIITRWKRQNKKQLQRIIVPTGRRQTYAFWLPRCYDHNCRTPEAVREIMSYCHNNPVKAGLVSEPGDWRWSSFKWYVGERDSIVQVDNIEL